MNFEKDSVKENTKSLVSLSSDDDSVDSSILGGSLSIPHPDIVKPIILNNSLSNEESVPLMAPPVLHEQSAPSPDNVIASSDNKSSVYADSVIL